MRSAVAGNDFEITLRMSHFFREQRAGCPVGEFRGLCSCGGAVYYKVSEEISGNLNLQQALALM